MHEEDMQPQAPLPKQRKYRLFMPILLMLLVAGLGGYYVWSMRPYTAASVGGDGIDQAALDGLNQIRKITKKRWRVTSGYRNPTHNSRVGGASASQHTKGLAFDVVVPIHKREKFYQAAKSSGFTAFGWGNTIVHIDMGPQRWWTYDDRGKALSVGQKEKYLHKAPNGFLTDYGLEINP